MAHAPLAALRKYPSDFTGQDSPAPLWSPPLGVVLAIGGLDANAPALARRRIARRRLPVRPASRIDRIPYADPRRGELAGCRAGQRGRLHSGLRARPAHPGGQPGTATT